MPKKIKNPEKYIHRLKLEIRRLEVRIYDEMRHRRKYAGTCYVNWSPGTEIEEKCTAQNLGAFRVGDYVAVTGRVVDVHEHEHGSTIRFKRIQTKKVEAI